jgi:hypothetical protein
LSLTLGGGEVTLLDLTTAFHTIANGGKYQAPQAILFSTGAAGVQDFMGLNLEPVQVISPEAAYLITDILSDNEARLPAFGQNNPLRLSQPAAAKTGTTTDFRDNWTEGFTRYLVAGVWAGNSDGRPMRNVSGVTGAAPIWHAFMEAVLADPEMTALLEAPTDAASWQFIAPDGIVSRPITCPSGISCNEDEVFDQRWLDFVGTETALADSAVVASMNTVYINRGNGNFPVGACSDTEGTTRQLLRLPVGLTRSLAQLETADTLLRTALAADSSFQDTANNAAQSEEPPVDEELARRIREEQRAALAWSSRNNSPLYFGPCAQVEEVVRQVFGNSVQSVSISRFIEQTANVGDESEFQRAQNVSAQAAPVDVAKPSTSYGSAGVAHDTSCGGDFVLGSVYNAHGQLIQAVAVIYKDAFGNSNYAAAVNGAYRFPVASPGTPHNIYISLVDAAGNPVSPTVTVPHRQGGPSDLGCHYVIWQGAD